MPSDDVRAFRNNEGVYLNSADLAAHLEVRAASVKGLDKRVTDALNEVANFIRRLADSV